MNLILAKNAALFHQFQLFEERETNQKSLGQKVRHITSVTNSISAIVRVDLGCLN